MLLRLLLGGGTCRRGVLLRSELKAPTLPVLLRMLRMLRMLWVLLPVLRAGRVLRGGAVLLLLRLLVWLVW